jgi:hypothetical protein
MKRREFINEAAKTVRDSELSAIIRRLARFK